MAYTAVADMVMAYRVMTYTVMAYTAATHIVMAYKAIKLWPMTFFERSVGEPSGRLLYSYGL